MIAVNQILTGSQYRVDSKLMIGQFIFQGLSVTEQYSQKNKSQFDEMLIRSNDK